MRDIPNGAGVPRLSRYMVAIPITGLAAAAIEMAVVLPVQPLLGDKPIRIFWIIAAGALGRRALQGGPEIVFLGAAIHVFVSVVAAAVYIFAARWWDDVLIKKPVISGMTFGFVCYVVMTFIVIPLSALGYRPNPSIVDIWASVAIHVFAFGLPIGIIGSNLLSRRTPKLAAAE